MAKLTLTFKNDGTVRKETTGFTGGSCVERTRFIDNALAGKADRQYKPEYYHDDNETVSTTLSA
jgi:hypothetical protein